MDTGGLMSSEPKQARSIDSTSRMLDAGEELFRQGGGPMLKLNLIIERANCSTGSFYARFGDMQGYYDALHARALDRIGSELSPVLLKASKQETVSDIVHVFITGLTKTLRKFQATLYFFAVGGAQVTLSRPRGSEFTMAYQNQVKNLIRPHLLEPHDTEANRRLDVLVRVIIAMSFQMIMFENREISDVHLSDKELVNQLTAILTEGILPFTKLEA